jgi:hypothetical protein
LKYVTTPCTEGHTISGALGPVELILGPQLFDIARSSCPLIDRNVYDFFKPWPGEDRRNRTDDPWLGNGCFASKLYPQERRFVRFWTEPSRYSYLRLHFALRSYGEVTRVKRKSLKIGVSIFSEHVHREINRLKGSTVYQNCRCQFWYLSMDYLRRFDGTL